MGNLTKKRTFQIILALLLLGSIFSIYFPITREKTTCIYAEGNNNYFEDADDVQADFDGATSPFYPSGAPTKKIAALTITAGYSQYWLQIDSAYTYVSAASVDTSICEPGRINNRANILVVYARNAGETFLKVQLKENATGIIKNYTMPIRCLARTVNGSWAHFTAYNAGGQDSRLYYLILNANPNKTYTETDLRQLRSYEAVDYFNGEAFAVDLFGGPSLEKKNTHALCNIVDMDGSSYYYHLITNGDKSKTGSAYIETTDFYKKDVGSIHSSTSYGKKILDIYYYAYQKGLQVGFGYTVRSNINVSLQLTSLQHSPIVTESVESFIRDGESHEEIPEYIYLGDQLTLNAGLSFGNTNFDIYNKICIVLNINGEETVILKYMKPSVYEKASAEEREGYSTEKPTKTDFIINETYTVTQKDYEKGFFSMSVHMEYDYETQYGGQSTEGNIEKAFTIAKVVTQKEDHFAFSNLTLDGSVSLNVYLEKEFCDKIARNYFAEGSHSFQIAFKRVEDYFPFSYCMQNETAEIYTDASTSKEYYKFSVQVPATQITQEIVIYYCALLPGSTTSPQYVRITSTSINDYIQYVLETEQTQEGLQFKNEREIENLAQANNFSYGEAVGNYRRLCNMLASMLNYGNELTKYQVGNSQIELTPDQITLLNNRTNGYTDTFQSIPTNLTAHQLVGDFTKTGIDFIGTSLILSSNTSLRIYFLLKDEYELDHENAVSVREEHIIVSNTGTMFKLTNEMEIHYDEDKNIYYINLPNIIAPRLDRVHHITFSCSKENETIVYTIDLSVLTYMKQVFESDNTSLKELCKALYWYYYYSNQYFSPTQN